MRASISVLNVDCLPPFAAAAHPRAVIVLGTAANGAEQCRNTPYRLIERTMGESVPAPTGEKSTL